MFKKILIANRGEIACRVIRTARAMGIKTVATYSDADADAPHVRHADEAVHLGPPPPAESYLAIDKIVEAVLGTGSEAVHPGYGFLAENPDFAEAVEAAGAAFIGPGPEAIALMGDKLQAKKLALKAGLEPIPGPLEPVPSARDAMRAARELGYPVVLKAAAGGGGKGMRVVRDDEETREGFGAARAEALTAFGDDRLFVEKLIDRSRHIEIQILADTSGHTIHLGERECSIQRRYQKVIEEAPSPLVDAEMRAAMGARAVALVKMAGYRSAGTVEFVVDEKKNVYFLEMNTRLQVEHTVTELVTGLDLVEEMIRVAAGERLTLTQESVRLEGWAIEARVYAEDPERGFLPSAGRLVRYRPPAGDGIRVDDGVEEGSQIPLYYDPMIAKLCAFGTTRPEALDRLRAAVDAFLCRGVSHNLRFLAAVLRHPRFAEGRLGTRFIAEAYPEGFRGAPLEGEERDVLVATGLLVHLRESERAERISGRISGHRPTPRQRWVVNLEGADERVTVSPSEHGYAVKWRRRRLAVRSSWRPGEPLVRATVNDRAVSVEVERLTEGHRLAYGGLSARVVVRSERETELARLMPERAAGGRSRHLLSPMPGLVVSVAVAPGDEVKAGQPLAVVDAMKMENVLRAERDGRIAKVRVAAGDSLAADQVILEFT